MEKNYSLGEFLFKELEGFIKGDRIQEAKERIMDLSSKIVKPELGCPKSNCDALNLFIEAKRIEGCSEKTLNYYKTTLIFIFNVVRKEYYLINTEDLRNVLSDSVKYFV